MNKNKYPGWTDRNANDLANFCAALSALVLGIITFTLIYGVYHLVMSGNWIISFWYNVLIAVLALLFLIFLPLIRYFSNKHIEYVQYLADESEKDVNYVISGWSISTLKFAGIPEDITECLSETFKVDYNSNSKTGTTLVSAQDLIQPLEKMLGNTRISEYKELILKYTRRDIPVSNDAPGSPPANPLDDGRQLTELPA